MAAISASGVVGALGFIALFLAAVVANEARKDQEQPLDMKLAIGLLGAGATLVAAALAAM